MQWTMSAKNYAARAVILLVLSSCEGDVDNPLGPPVTQLISVVRVTPDPTGVVGEHVLPAPKIRVTGPDGRAAPNTRVTFTVADGNGRLTYADTLTDAKGEAQAEWVLGTNASASNVLHVTTTGAPDTVTFRATAVAGHPVRINSSSTAESVAFARKTVPAPSVIVIDQFGNGVANAFVHFAITAGRGSVGGKDSVTVKTSATGQASAPWILGDPGRNAVTAHHAGTGTVAFETIAIDSATASWFLTPTQADATHGVLQYRIALGTNGYFFEGVYAPEVGNFVIPVSRFVGQYRIDGDILTLNGCSHFDSTAHCSVKTGKISSTTLLIGSLRYTALSTLTPPFPAISRPAQIFEGVDSPYYSMHGSPLASRYVLYDDKTFALQYSSAKYSFFEYRGTYTSVDDVITFEWEGWSTAGPWGATAKLSGDTLDVRYNIIMVLSDFADGLYIRKKQ